jgi:hypothetical protein
VFCALDEERAWWKDTAHESWSPTPKKGAWIEIPLNQPVDGTTKDAVQKIALQRPRYVPPGVLPFASSRRLLKRDELVPEKLRKLSVQDMSAVLHDIYVEMDDAHVTVVERDGLALAAARLIQYNLRCFESGSIDSFLKIVLSRLLSEQQGGRSNTLAALACLLQPGLHHQFDRAFSNDLETAIHLAVTAKTFVNPEFALVIGASLVARFPAMSHLSDHVRCLTLRAFDCPQTPEVKRVAGLLKNNFEQHVIPLDRLVTGRWLAKGIVRPLRQDDDIFRRREEAVEAAWRIVQVTPARARLDDLALFNQLTRLQAIEQLHRLAH